MLLVAFFFVLSVVMSPVTGFAQENINNINVSEQKPVCFDLKYSSTLRSKDSFTRGEVTKLQDFLRSEGLLAVESSGYFGVMTQKALKVYQKQNGISPTGNLGPLTRASIRTRSCVPPVVTKSRVQDIITIATSTPTPPQVNPTPPVSVAIPAVPTPPTMMNVSGVQVPASNMMSCASPSVKGLANGKVGCYGLWTNGQTFGGDANMCPEDGRSPGIQCKIKTEACEAGQAFATRAIRPNLLELSSLDLEMFAKNLQTTPDIVKQHVFMLWEYRCSDYGLSTYGTQ